jgi:hypothetical protein
MSPRPTIPYRPAVTNTMRFGIALQSNKTPAEYVAQAKTIERYAFDVVSVYNDLFFQPALGPLLLMAPHLRTAQLGPAALNPSAHRRDCRADAVAGSRTRSRVPRLARGAGSTSWASCSDGRVQMSWQTAACQLGSPPPRPNRLWAAPKGRSVSTQRPAVHPGRVAAERRRLHRAVRGVRERRGWPRASRPTGSSKLAGAAIRAMDALASPRPHLVQVEGAAGPRRHPHGVGEGIRAVTSSRCRADRARAARRWVTGREVASGTCAVVAPARPGPSVALTPGGLGRTRATAARSAQPAIAELRPLSSACRMAWRDAAAPR